MSETHCADELGNEGEEEDDSYANAYMDDDDIQESDDADLAEMLAKVHSIQQVEGQMPNKLPSEVKCDPPETIAKHSGGSTAEDSRKTQALPRSPLATAANPSTIAYKSQDGITTISRGAFSARNAAGTLLGMKKSAVYEDKLLQSARTANTLHKLKQKTVAAAPAAIRKRIETLSVPIEKPTTRKFATDDEEKHCRFRTGKRSAQRSSSRDDFDSSDSGQTFISRMEAAERNRQKKFELSRGENDYNARLDKKSCPKCGAPQSYSEYRDKKKKCQMCGVEFRFLNAWGDIEHSFTSRMADASRAQAEKRSQIYAQMIAEEANRLNVAKTARQLLYEKRIAQKQSKGTFLERNYKPSKDSKTKQAQLELQAKRNGGLKK